MDKTILGYAIIPIIAALIGWITNYIAIKMIFRPRKAVRILGFEIMGLIPRRRADMARKIGETIERELISHRDIQEMANSPAFHEKISQVLRGKIDEFIDTNLGSNPIVGMFLSAAISSGIRDALVKEIEKLLPDAIDLLFSGLEANFDFKELIRKKIEGFDMAKLEAIVYAIASRELKSIEMYGGVLGFLVGLFQVGILVILK
jgi:uncharacterized membrane protein YheB (UPF0754 family)